MHKLRELCFLCFGKSDDKVEPSCTVESNQINFQGQRNEVTQEGSCFCPCLGTCTDSRAC